jgi:murein DD-endopeptidase MepM/ murein hydrolase activator NlpD
MDMSKNQVRVFYTLALIFALIGALIPTNSVSAASTGSSLAFFTLPDNSSGAPSIPKNFFQFPFPTGRVWRMTGGPHPYIETEQTKVSLPSQTSLDFAPAWHSGCDIPNNGKDFIVAAAGGDVHYASSDPNKLTIDHNNGWFSEYFHITTVQVKSGHVDKGQPLGYPSCHGGSADGAHVHFTIYYGKTYPTRTRQSIIGLSIEGWTVLSTTTPYVGCLQNNITLQKVCRQLNHVSDDANKTFRAMRTIVDIKSVFSNKVFTINKGSLPNLANDYIIQKTWKGSSDQKWYLIPVDATYYEIMSVDSKKCLDIEGGYKLSFGKAQQYTCNNSDAQRFSFVKVSGNQYYIQAKHSGLMLDIQNWTKGDALILQMSRLPTPTQYWMMSIK